jgi:hypothetical protein
MKLLFLFFLLLCIAACKKSDDAPVAPKMTVNDITLTAKQLSVPATTYDPGPYSIQSVMVGNTIYFGNYSNTAKPQFFVRYDINSNSFSSALAQTSTMCSCGYSSKLVSDGTTIFFIANEATKYTVSSNIWSTIAYPSTAEDNNGEAGVGYFNGNIYFVGGRIPSTLFKYYSIGQDKWFTAPAYLYATNRSQLSAYKDRLYVLGGEGAKRKMSYFSTVTNTWIPLKDVPFDVYGSYENTALYESTLSAVLGDHLYLLQNGSIYIYDLVNEKWAKDSVKIDGLPVYANLFSNGLKLYISGKTASNSPTVFEVSMSTK